MPSMPESLEFENLPLVRVEVSLFFETPEALSFDRLNEIRLALAPHFDRVDSYMGGATGGLPFTFSVGTVPGMMLGQSNGGITAYIHPDGIQIAWSGNGDVGGYPRYYATMRPITALTNEVLVKEMKAVKLAYVVQSRSEEGSVQELLASELVPPLVPKDGTLHDINVSWHDVNNVDRRVMTQTLETGYQISTIAGKFCSSSPLDTLDEIHEVLIDQFPSVLSSHAKSTWRLQNGA